MIRASFPSFSTRFCHVLTMSLVGLLLAVLLLSEGSVHGAGGATVRGLVVNGTSGADIPTGIEVTLHIFGIGGEVVTAGAIADDDGQFMFEDVEARDDSIYAITARYQEVLYSRGLDFGSLVEPVELLMYEATGSIEDIVVDADVLLLRGVNRDERSVAAFEVVSLSNVGDRTFVPDLNQPELMNFMRFSIPLGATDLDVRSDLTGGDVISVGTGFALTAPVIPGSHEVAYSFRFPYQGSGLEYDRSFPMGAGTFRLLVGQDLGSVHTSLLESMPPADFDGKSHRVWGASDLNPGTRIGIEITHLPQPGRLSRLGDALNDGPYLRMSIPAVVGAMLVAILGYAMFFQGARVPHAMVRKDLDWEGMGAESFPTSDRMALVDAIAHLDDLYQCGGIAQGEYKQRRGVLKASLLRIAPEP